MKVLWITNILFPEAVQLLTGNGDLKSSGGWMLGAADGLLQKNDIELVVASVSNSVSNLTMLRGKDIIYYVLPMGHGNQKVNNEYIPLWKQINKEVNPTIVHIHGTEFSHGLAYMKACGSENVVVSIQGLTSAIAPYYCAGLSKWDIYQNITFRDLVRGSILKRQKIFKQRGKFEKETIQMVRHIIGRTSWDRTRIWAINPNVKYHFCNETLREEFYHAGSWQYEKCHKHSIFLSQASNPIKGLHQVIKAMPFILRIYPDASICVAGEDIINTHTWSQKIRYSGYGSYIKHLIRKFHLEDRVYFTGNLNASEMIHAYLNANVFICPSVIENSPNSLGEAQILGVPCVASYVGGIPDMMDGNEENLYRYEEVEMLAKKVCNIFKNKAFQIDMKEKSARRHNPVQNCEQLYSIYKDIIDNKV